MYLFVIKREYVQVCVLLDTFMDRLEIALSIDLTPLESGQHAFKSISIFYIYIFFSIKHESCMSVCSRFPKPTKVPGS